MSSPAEQLEAALVLERLAGLFPARQGRPLDRRAKALLAAAEALRKARGELGALEAVQAASEAPRGR